MGRESFVRGWEAGKDWLALSLVCRASPNLRRRPGVHFFFTMGEFGCFIFSINFFVKLYNLLLYTSFFLRGKKTSHPIVVTF
jgi:diphthamide synthase (EF-2-diphthine--ammonia ligase)